MQDVAEYLGEKLRVQTFPNLRVVQQTSLHCPRSSQPDPMGDSQGGVPRPGATSTHSWNSRNVGGNQGSAQLHTLSGFLSPRRSLVETFAAGGAAQWPRGVAKVARRELKHVARGYVARRVIRFCFCRVLDDWLRVFPSTLLHALL